MNLTEIDKLIETFRMYIPQGNTKKVIIKISLIIHNYLTNFKNTDNLTYDFSIFDDNFYGSICDTWIEEIVLYTIDEPREGFEELFKDFRLASHRSIAESFTENKKYEIYQ